MLSAGIFSILFLLTGVAGTVQAIHTQKNPGKDAVMAQVEEDAGVAKPSEPVEQGNHTDPEHLAMWNAGAET